MSGEVKAKTRSGNRSLPAIAIGASFLAASCTPSSGQSWVAENVPTIDRVGDTLNISGTMDTAMLELLSRQAWTSIATIRFRSAGGMPEPGLRIAQLVARTGKPIVLHDLCASACLDVLVIRGRVTIEPSTIILLHNNPIGQALVTRRYPVIAAYIDRWGKHETAWLTANGVDPVLALMAQAATVPVCVYAYADVVAQVPNLAIATRYDVWAPRDATLRDLGVDAVARSKDWHQTRLAVLAAMRLRYPKANLAKMRAGDEPAPPPAAALRINLSSVPICTGALSEATARRR